MAPCREFLPCLPETVEQLLHGDRVIAEHPVHTAIEFPEQHIAGAHVAGADMLAIGLVALHDAIAQQHVMSRQAGVVFSEAGIA